MKMTPKKFDPSTLKSFDRVLGMCGNTWKCDLFSHYAGTHLIPYICVGGSYKMIIPYNEATKDLAGSTEDPPNYYKYWKK